MTEGSEVERPQGLGEGLSEIGSERRYATRQATRKQQGSQLGSTKPDKVCINVLLASVLYCRALFVGTLARLVHITHALYW